MKRENLVYLVATDQTGNTVQFQRECPPGVQIYSKEGTWTCNNDHKPIHYQIGSGVRMGVTDDKLLYARSNVIGVYDSTKPEQLNNAIVAIITATSSAD
ncbi:MAG: hypothetical protein WCL61_01400 [bacterium]